MQRVDPAHRDIAVHGCALLVAPCMAAAAFHAYGVGRSGTHACGVAQAMRPTGHAGHLQRLRLGPLDACLRCRLRTARSNHQLAMRGVHVRTCGGRCLHVPGPYARVHTHVRAVPAWCALHRSSPP